MKITAVRLGMISVPLRVPFKTALRSVSSVEDVIVEIHTDTGAVGYGEAPPTGVITGDTTGAIIGAIRDHIAKTIIGRDVDEFEDLMIALNAYTLCSGVICEELNGTEYVAVPFLDDEENQNSTMEIGYLVRKNYVLSEVGNRYVAEIREYLTSHTERIDQQET